VPPVLVRLRDATLGYGRSAVLRDVNLWLRRGDFLGLVGPNGSGKTTLLRTILGSILPLSGAIERSPSGVRFGYVPQRKALDEVWPLRAREIVLMGLYPTVGLFRRPGRIEQEAADAALSAVGMEELGDEMFSDLSGGQKQRTLIARALVTAPDVLAFDEPTAGMDLPGGEAILSLLRKLHREGMTVVLVSHYLNEVASAALEVGLVGNARLAVGTTGEMVTAERLTGLYGAPVHVARVHGRLVVLAGAAGDPVL